MDQRDSYPSVVWVEGAPVHILRSPTSYGQPVGLIQLWHPKFSNNVRQLHHVFEDALRDGVSGHQHVVCSLCEHACCGTQLCRAEVPGGHACQVYFCKRCADGPTRSQNERCHVLSPRECVESAGCHPHTRVTRCPANGCGKRYTGLFQVDTKATVRAGEECRMRCPNSGCPLSEQPMPACQFEDHVSKHCKFRQVRCEFCNDLLRRWELLVHMYRCRKAPQDAYDHHVDRLIHDLLPRTKDGAFLAALVLRCVRQSEVEVDESILELIVRRSDLRRVVAPSERPYRPQDCAAHTAAEDELSAALRGVDIQTGAEIVATTIACTTYRIREDLWRELLRHPGLRAIQARISSQPRLLGLKRGAVEDVEPAAASAADMQEPPAAPSNSVASGAPGGEATTQKAVATPSASLMWLNGHRGAHAHHEVEPETPPKRVRRSENDPVAVIEAVPAGAAQGQQVVDFDDGVEWVDVDKMRLPENGNHKCWLNTVLGVLAVTMFPLLSGGNLSPLASRLRIILAWILGNGSDNVGDQPKQIHDIQQWLAWYIVSRTHGLEGTDFPLDMKEVDGWVKSIAENQLTDAQCPKEAWMGILDELLTGRFSAGGSCLRGRVERRFDIMGVRTVIVGGEGCTCAETGGEAEERRWAMDVHPNRVRSSTRTVHFRHLIHGFSVTDESNHKADCPLHGLARDDPARRASRVQLIQGQVGEYVVVNLMRGTYDKKSNSTRLSTRPVTFMPWEYQELELFPEETPASLLEQYNPVYKVGLWVEAAVLLQQSSMHYVLCVRRRTGGHMVYNDLTNGGRGTETKRPSAEGLSVKLICRVVYQSKYMDAS